MKQRVRILNDDGLRRFRSWLQSGGVGDPPRDALLDTATADILPGAGEVEMQEFPSRYELAAHVNDALQDCDFNRISYAAGLWAWLSLFYIDLLCPGDHQGKRTVLELPRYLLTPEYRNYYRHLIREAVVLVRRNGEFARALLTSRAGRFRISRVFEDIASRQDLISNPGVVELVWRLYFNPKRQTVRAGVSGQNRPGGIRRLGLVLQQLSLNYDLPALTARQIAELLPHDFDTWKRRANWEELPSAERPRGSAPRVRFDGIPVGSEWRLSQLADHWGYSDRHALRGQLIAPHGQAFLVLFATGGAGCSAIEIGSADRAPDWNCSLPQALFRRISRAAKEKKHIHLFTRFKPGQAFSYRGEAHVVSADPVDVDRCSVKFQFPQTRVQL